MNLSNRRGIYTVVYRDNTLTSQDTHTIVTDYQQLDNIAASLAKNLVSNQISHNGITGQSEYLISGILVKTNRVRSPKDELNVDEISLYGEVKATLEMVASSIGLPNIKSFREYK
ncbi:hypothetical protein FJZ18_04715 [Candidatus Pacearchaeota archaeon]|nr:hypothetical protein [Candidatus Pacearchaeota archaeon]